MFLRLSKFCLSLGAVWFNVHWEGYIQIVKNKIFLKYTTTFIKVNKLISPCLRCTNLFKIHTSHFMQLPALWKTNLRIWECYKGFYFLNFCSCHFPMMVLLWSQGEGTLHWFVKDNIVYFLHRLHSGSQTLKNSKSWLRSQDLLSPNQEIPNLRTQARVPDFGARKSTRLQRQMQV